MQLKTIDKLDDKLWPQALHLYHQSFSKETRKTDAIIVGMFTKRMTLLQVLLDGSDVQAMAITGLSNDGKLLLIDYLAVREELRGKGIGQQFVGILQQWAAKEKRLDGILIEVESEPTLNNQQRIRFWESCGFHLTEYIHQYTWVPEPYQAMYLAINKEAGVANDGEKLFRHITSFHKRAYSKS
ncbi:MAG: GNAT family N-acetyltransferase [Candidatus Pristimantibacillus sp.]